MSLMSMWYAATVELGLPVHKVSVPVLVINQFNKHVLESWHIKAHKFAEILELPADQMSEPRLIKKQYREMSKKYHPDTCSNSHDCEEQNFLNITDARTFLLKNDPIAEIKNDSRLSDMQNMTDFILKHNADIVAEFNAYLSYNNGEIFPYFNLSVEKDAELLGSIFHELDMQCS